MGLKICKRETEFGKLFAEDINLYYDIMERYLKLTPENYVGAYELSKDALVMVDRFSNLSADATKLSLSNVIAKTNKTDIKDFCYRKLKVMHGVYETARMVWNKGEQASRERRS